MRQPIAAGIVIAGCVLASIGAAASEPASGPIFINEVAWAGASWSPTAEWIELFNASSEPVDLEGWRLVSSDGSPDIVLDGLLEPRDREDPAAGFFLLERGNDGSVPDVPADLLYEGALSDAGETLYLYDPDRRLADSANAPEGAPSLWPAGTDAHGDPAYASMERRDARLPDGPDAWASSTADPSPTTSARPIRGTPGQGNATFNVPPMPTFVCEPRAPQPGVPATFDATGSYDENDRISSYRWDFGDGATGTGETASHTYKHPGTYDVVLTLADDKGGESELIRTVSVKLASPPVADFSIISLAPDRVFRAGSAVRFQDESSDPDGPIVERKWDLGDGVAASGADVLHTYDRSGRYTIRLRVLDNQGEAAVQTQSLTIASRMPTARFTWYPERPIVGEPVRLDASGSCDPDGRLDVFRWDLDGDGSYETETDVSVVDHAFTAGGDYDVRLTVVDEAGEVSPPYAQSIPVNRPPIAEFQLSAFRADELASLQFTDLSQDEDGTIVERLWTFGDGTTATSTNPAHAFDEAGTYTVSLTVVDDGGARQSTDAEVVVSNLPPVARLTSAQASRPTGEPFGFDASGSADPSPSGSIVRYEWDLDGDGAFEETTACPTIDRAYSEDGTYDVLVRVVDDDEASAVSDPLSVHVTNRPPQITRVIWAPERPDDEEEVLFSATGRDADGQIARWLWDFGDDAAVTGSGPTVRFPDDGLYTVVVTVEDDDGARSDPYRIDIRVENAPPVAGFTVAHLPDRCVSLDARESFDPSPSGFIPHVAWDFGDGTSCPGTSDACAEESLWTPRHCYSASGTYLVTLVVIDEQGALTRTSRTLLVAD